jgi:SAM-dependent methyltransferase
MSDPIAEYNRRRWDALARAGSVFNRPYLDLDPATARQVLDPGGRLGPVEDRDVLCLAAGGGRQSIAFALLGARVTVLDLSEEVLERDHEAARHHGVEIDVQQGDMRDLSRFEGGTFDLVWQPYSITFVPDARAVLREVARVLRPGGRYHLQLANPFTLGLGSHDWDGQGYVLRLPYVDGARIEPRDEPWTFRGDEAPQEVPPPREYRHTLSTVINGLVEHGFQIDHLSEHIEGHPESQPGSWEHFTSVAPPWLYLWSSLGSPPTTARNNPPEANQEP